MTIQNNCNVLISNVIFFIIYKIYNIYLLNEFNVFAYLIICVVLFNSFDVCGKHETITHVVMCVR